MLFPSSFLDLSIFTQSCRTERRGRQRGRGEYQKERLACGRHASATNSWSKQETQPKISLRCKHVNTDWFAVATSSWEYGSTVENKTRPQIRGD